MIRLLLVDDSDAIVDLLKAILEIHGGFAVTTASSAAEAMDLLSAREFEVVLTDVRMETPLAGFEVARAAGKLLPRPVIVLLTASSPLTSDWKSSGADEFLPKGPGALEIPKKVEALLQAREQRRTSVA
ncbi:MAG: response regulator [Terriglobales bacterium]|jgi:CheY-like chemotaxis protein